MIDEIRQKWGVPVFFNTMGNMKLLRMSMISEKEIKEKRKRLRIDVRNVSLKLSYFFEETLNVHYEIDSKQKKPSEVKQNPPPESKKKKVP